MVDAGKTLGFDHQRYYEGNMYSGKHIRLVVEPYSSEKYESVGMMNFPTEWTNKIHVPNHQPDIVANS